MNRILSVLLAALLLCGCSAPTQAVDPAHAATPETAEIPYESQFKKETVIRLADTGMDVTGPNSLAVFGSNDIIYYEDRDIYESGNPYGEGEDTDKHTAAEAEKHYVVNITKPGAYRLTGQLPCGQIRVDLGEDAYDDPTAVVELILDDAEIGCTVAPAILFMNVYECDGNWSKDTATADVDTSAAGANLILEGENTVSGSYVAKIYKDKDGEKKLWKQDGAIYSYMSLNVFGPGKLTLNAENEGMDTELHLTVNGGDITILSGNDGINTNEDNVSVTTINAGSLHIVAGLGAEGDGIDSNGYLVINGGTVISAAKPQSDSGLDSSKGSFIHGGTVVALGAAMDWAESDSKQVTVNLQFSRHQTGPISIQNESGTEIFSFDPTADSVLKEYGRSYQGLILSSPSFRVGDSCTVTVGGQQMMYTSTDVMRGPGGMGGFGPGGEMPARPEGEMPTWAEGEAPTPPEGSFDQGHRGDRNPNGGKAAEGSTVFYMMDKVNFFSGISEAE